MIDVTYLYCGYKSASVAHRYGDSAAQNQRPDLKPFEVPKSASKRKPIVVWNITRSCNLKCIHCYSDSERKHYAGELSTKEAKAVIDDLASYQVPAILFSGGEPLLRRDLFELVRYAHSKKIRTVLSSNGTLISPQVAREIKDIGFSYVGISLDGIGDMHDFFRGVKGTFEKTLAGIRNLISVGQKTGLRLTLTQHTIDEIDQLFDLAELEGIKRICFYHLVPSGRGKEIFQIDPNRTREGIDRILERSKELIDLGYPIEVLTVDNHVDGAYVYLKLLEQKSPRSEEVYKRLLWNGGALHSSGTGISCIDSQGNVHPDQFWTQYSLGNVRENKFSEIWENAKEPMLHKLRNRDKYIYGRCKSCRFFSACGGGLRVRAKICTGDTWYSDPACYLTNDETGVHGE